MSRSLTRFFIALLLFAGVLARLLTPDSFFSAIGEAWAESHATSELLAANDKPAVAGDTSSSAASAEPAWESALPAKPEPAAAPSGTLNIAPPGAVPTMIPNPTGSGMVPNPALRGVAPTAYPPTQVRYTDPFSANLTPATSPEALAAMAAANKQDFKIFSLINADANETVVQLKQLFGPSVTAVADVRTNQVLAQGNSELLRMIEAIVVKLDGTESRSGKLDSKGAGSGSLTVSGGSGGGGSGGFGGGFATQGGSGSGSARTGGQGGASGGGGFGAATGGRNGGRSGPVGSRRTRSTDSEIREADEAVQAAAIKAKDVDEKWKEGSKLLKSSDKQESQRGFEQLNQANQTINDLKVVIARRMRAKYDSSGLDNPIGQELSRLYNKTIAAMSASDYEDAVKIVERIAALLNENESFQLNLATSSQLVNLGLDNQDTNANLCGSVARHLQNWVEASKAFAAAEPRLADPTTGTPKLAGATLDGARASAGGTSGESGSSTVSIPDLEKQFREADAAARAARAKNDEARNALDTLPDFDPQATVQEDDATRNRRIQLQNQFTSANNGLKAAIEERNRLEMLLVMSGPAAGTIISVDDLENRMRVADAEAQAIQKKIEDVSKQFKEVQKGDAAEGDKKSRLRKLSLQNINNREELATATEERNRLVSLLVMAGHASGDYRIPPMSTNGTSDYVVRNVTTTLPNGTQTTRQELVAVPRASEAELRQLIELAKLAAQSSKAGNADESAALLQKVTEALEQQRRAAGDQRRAAEAQRRQMEADMRGQGTARAGVNDRVASSDRAAWAADRAQQLKQQLEAIDAQIKIAKNLSETVSKKITAMVKTSATANAEIAADVQQSVTNLAATAHELQIQLDDYQNRKQQIQSELAALSGSDEKQIDSPIARQLADLKKRIQDQAEQYRAAASDPTSAGSAQAQRSQIEGMLKDLLAAESTMQREELQQLKNRVDKLAQNLDEREKNRDEIVNRKLKELLKE